MHLHLPLARTFVPWLPRCHTLALSGATPGTSITETSKTVSGRMSATLMIQVAFVGLHRPGNKLGGSFVFTKTIHFFEQIAKVAPMLRRLILHGPTDSVVAKALTSLKKLEGSVYRFSDNLRPSSNSFFERLCLSD